MKRARADGFEGHQEENGENVWERIKIIIRKITGCWISWSFIGHCKGLAFAHTMGRDRKLLET